MVGPGAGTIDPCPGYHRAHWVRGDRGRGTISPEGALEMLTVRSHLESGRRPGRGLFSGAIRACVQGQCGMARQPSCVISQHARGWGVEGGIPPFPGPRNVGFSQEWKLRSRECPHVPPLPSQEFSLLRPQVPFTPRAGKIWSEVDCDRHLRSREHLALGAEWGQSLELR